MSFASLRFAAGSIAAKQLLILLAMSGATAAAVTTALIVFGMLSASIERLNTTVMPDIGVSMSVIQGTGSAQSAVAGILTARDREVLAERHDIFVDANQSLAALVGELQPESRALLAPQVDALNSAVDELYAARLTEFEARARLADQIAALQARSEASQGLLIELKDAALFDLTIGGEDTVTLVQDTLNGLVEREFAVLQGALQLRADVNLAIGTSLALIETRDPAFAAILSDVATGALASFGENLAALQANERFAGQLDDLAETFEFVSALGERGYSRQAGVSERLVGLRQSSDAALSGLVDDLTFSLVILAADTATSNEDAIRGLLEDEAAKIVASSDVNAAMAYVFQNALIGAAAETQVDAEARQVALDAAIVDLDRLLADEQIDGALLDEVAAVKTLSSSDGGIVSVRTDFLDAEAASIAKSDVATRTLAQIASAARANGVSSLQTVTSASDEILTQTADAGQRMRLIAGVSLGVFLVALALTWFLIVRPMGRLARETERLATGSLDPIQGLSNSAGELGRMAKALHVFRDGILERKELEQQEREREEQLRAAAEEAERKKREDEKRAADEATRRKEEKRRLEEEAAAKEREAEMAAQAERDALAKEQSLVVNEIETALQRLSDGDLSIEITADFPPAYEGLRSNFNRAVVTLADVIRRLIESATTLESSSNEIAGSANELAARTEKAAAALEETAAAVTELDASAQSASSNANLVGVNMDEVRNHVSDGNHKVSSAVATMSEIEEASNEISSIVGLIEDIALQTNLLALNAGVEAARAGDAGEGFAVVANEVRSLAQRSSKAAGEIKGLISHSNEKISIGVTEVGEAGEIVKGILSAVEAVGENLKEIMNTSAEQANTVSEVSSSIGELDRTTQNNAAVFEESLAASEVLRSEATTLMQLTKRFKLAGHHGGDPAANENEAA